MKKNIKKQLVKKMDTIAQMTAKASMESACIYILHQPKMPDSVKKLGKKNA
ncbi:cyclic lactone autoinducer peptide [Lachnospiraceae bacterium PF1-21]|uniref:Cyclic lactone autoinducer peptide n=1 Tax=Ohessyouella blattaphilus TaxID=2949333 RepID=A0ABT1ELW0_9FIRM|nr:cyclic lactone autoinducer peptide [Ohessyouella blattaphilus]MCP1111469.1 cyclic lactone autoinducer peptide [Ohessyouella blattaphilus]MCR8564863.1 cyclic lactone autoinducer peptide [Ohessyouella blattaphilus]